MKTLAYAANARRGGICAFELGPDGALRERGRYLEGSGVAPLAASPDRRFLYASIRTPAAAAAAVAAFAVEPDGGLPLLNTVPSPGTLTHMRVDAGGRFLLAASYGGDFLMVWPLGRDGMIRPEPIQTLHPGRNPHCVALDAANRFAFVTALGSDRVAQYRFDEHGGILGPNSPPFLAAPRESGPRHIVLSPDNRFAYVLAELSGDVIAYALDPERGVLVGGHTVPILPPERALPPGRREAPAGAGGGAAGPVMWAADIRVTPDGRFLYASERAGSTLSWFSIDPISGRPEYAGVVDTEERPRGFAVDPLGRRILVAGEKSNHLAAYAIDAESGAPTLVDRAETGMGPTWVETLLL